MLCSEKVPAHVKSLLWTFVIRNAMFLIIEGLSQAKRVSLPLALMPHRGLISAAKVPTYFSPQCTPEGRAQMMLDFKQLQANMATVTEVKPLPGAALVESYVKAYYLTEAGVEEWMTTNKVCYRLDASRACMFRFTKILRAPPRNTRRAR